MLIPSSYLQLIRTKGRALSEINPGSDEIALSIDNTLHAVNLLEENGIAILGGDVLSTDNTNRLIYAYQLWGSEYISLNWYCEKEANENYVDYCNRSCKVAREAVLNALKISKQLGQECYIVLVI